MTKKTYNLVANSYGTYFSNNMEKKRTVSIGTAHQGVGKDGREYFFISLNPHINLASLPVDEKNGCITVNAYEKHSAGEHSSSKDSSFPKASYDARSTEDEVPF